MKTLVLPSVVKRVPHTPAHSVEAGALLHSMLSLACCIRRCFEIGHMQHVMSSCLIELLPNDTAAFKMWCFPPLEIADLAQESYKSEGDCRPHLLFWAAPFLTIIIRLLLCITCLHFKFNTFYLSIRKLIFSKSVGPKAPGMIISE